MINNESLPKCNICLISYDLERHKPFTMNNCGHSICKDCLDHLYGYKCPFDNSLFNKAIPNYTLLEIIEQNNKDLSTASSVDYIKHVATKFKFTFENSLQTTKTSVVQAFKDFSLGSIGKTWIF